MNVKEIARDMKHVFESNLPFQIPNFTQRLCITPDVEKYRWKEDESVWLQMRDKSYHSFEVLFDGEFVCFFDLGLSEREVIVRMLEGLRALFKQEKIFLHPRMYEVQKAANEVVLEKPHNETERIITSVLTKQLKRKGKKVVLKDKGNHVIN